MPKHDYHNFLFVSSTADKKEAIVKVIDFSSPRRAFFFMVVAASIIATLGLLVNSITVVIGAMLVAPLLSPLLALALGVVIFDYKAIYRSIRVIIKTLVLVLVFAFIISFFVHRDQLDTTLILNLIPSLPYFHIALAAGFAASISIVKNNLADFFARYDYLCSIVTAIMWGGSRTKIFQSNNDVGFIRIFSD